MNEELIDFSSDLFDGIDETPIFEETPVSSGIKKELVKLSEKPIELTRDKLIKAAQVSLYNLQEKTQIYDNISFDIAQIIQQKIVEKSEAMSIQALTNALQAIDNLSMNNRKLSNEILNPSQGNSSSPVNIIFEMGDSSSDTPKDTASIIQNSEFLSKLMDVSNIVSANRKSEESIIDAEYEESTEDE